MAIQKAPIPHNRQEKTSRQIVALQRRVRTQEGNPHIRKASDVQIHGAAIGQGDDGKAALNANVNASSITAGAGGHTVIVNNNQTPPSGGGGVIVASLSKSARSLTAGASESSPAGIRHIVQSSQGQSTQVTHNANGIKYQWPATDSSGGGGPVQQSSEGSANLYYASALSEFTVLSSQGSYAVKQSNNGDQFTNAICAADATSDQTFGSDKYATNDYVQNYTAWVGSDFYEVEWDDPNGAVIEYEPSNAEPYQVSAMGSIFTGTIAIGWKGGGHSVILTINGDGGTVTVDGNQVATISGFNFDISLAPIQATVSLYNASGGFVWDAEISEIGGGHDYGATGQINIGNIVGALPYTKITGIQDDTESNIGQPFIAAWNWSSWSETDTVAGPLTDYEGNVDTMTMDEDGVTFDADVSIEGTLTVNGTEITPNTGQVMIAGQYALTGDGTNSVTFNPTYDDFNSADTQLLVCSPCVSFGNIAAAWAGEVHTEDAGGGGDTFQMRATRTDGVFEDGTYYYFNWIAPIS